MKETKSPLSVYLRQALLLGFFVAPGSSGPQVDTLQSILVTDGYLAPQYVTGYYGSITEQAVEAFQTKEGIVSYGTPSTTGYGAVGPKTRGELNI